MEAMNQMPGSNVPPAPQPIQGGGDGHVCGRGCRHSILFGLLILLLVAGGIWWYATRYDLPTSLDVEEKSTASEDLAGDAALETELEATNLDNLDQESANLEAELSQ